MSKHLRFGRLLSLLAILLTMSFAWAQGQNLSSAKVLNTFGFTVVANGSAQLGSDCMGTVVTNSTTHTVAVTVPNAAVVTALKADFTSSLFSNVFINAAVPGVTPSVSGSGGTAVDYTNPVTVTVEAENHSFENYVVTVTKVAASTAKDITVSTASFSKMKPCPSTAVWSAAVPITFTGLNGTFNVNYGAVLTNIKVTIEISPLATCVPSVATCLAGLDFDAGYLGVGIGNGIPDTVSIVVTAQNGSSKTYKILPVIATLPSVEDNLVPTGSAVYMAGFPAGSTTPVANTSTQIITVTVPFSTPSVAPTWKISDWAHMYATEPAVSGATPTELCSGGSFALTTSPQTFNFWIQGEDRNEKSMWQLVVTKATCKPENFLTAVYATFNKTAVCPSNAPTATSGTVIPQTDVTINNTLNTVDFKVPYGVASVFIDSTHVSLLAKNASYGTKTPDPSHILDSLKVTSECGVLKQYTVTVTPSTVKATGKTLLTFGFKQTVNSAYAPTWPSGAVYAGTYDATAKRFTVKVPYSTDLHTLIATFTSSPYSCVAIANTNGYFWQTSGTTPNDHSNSLTYVVRAEDGTEERFDIVVTKEDVGGNSLIGLKTTMDYCFSSSLKLVENGVYTNTSSTVTDIALSVRYGTTVATLPVTFTASPWAVVRQGSLTATPLTPNGSGVYTATLGGSPVSFYVTSDGGTTMRYIVTTTVRARNSTAKLLTYKFESANNYAALGGNDAVGVVDETAKTVMVKVPWKAKPSITNLVASFTLSTNAVMTHSEDTQVLQVSGTTGNDFTTPVAYTVWPEDCNVQGSMTVEYFVTVQVEPDQTTGISEFTFDVEECETGCPLTNIIDSYARRIFITVPFTTDISDLAPYHIGLTTGATISGVDDEGDYEAQDWTGGPVSYVVTAPDGVTKATWTVLVTNPPCKEHNILTFELPDIQIADSLLVPGFGEPVVIDTANHTIDVIIKKGATLRNVHYHRTLSCGATVCCVGGNCQDNQVLDFSEGGCHTCVVTAEDVTVKQDWTICVHELDTTIPKVFTWSVMADNCTAVGKVDSVAVRTDLPGRVFIVNETVLDKTAKPSWLVSGYDLTDWTNDATVATSVAKLVANHLGNWAEVGADMVDSMVYVKTNGLYSGTYWAFAVADNGQISCISDQKLFLDICEVDVATICALRGMTDVWRYRITEEVWVNYEQAHTGGNWKFIQDATCGILIEDQLNALTGITYGIGTTVKNIIGTLDKSNPLYMKFIPVCCYTPEKVATGGTIPVVKLTYDEFKSQVYTTTTKYESMLVQISTPVKIFSDYTAPRTKWTNDGLEFATTSARGDYNYFVQDVLNSALVTPVNIALPTVPIIIQGLRTNIDLSSWGSGWGKTGMITPRSKSDIVTVTDPLLTYKPIPVTIVGVLPGQCKSTTITMYNEGVGDLNITALYLDDTPASDEFNILTPPAVPFVMGTWTSKVITVNFCPVDAGSETTNLIVEFGIGKTLVIPINGATQLIFDLPYYQSWNYTAGPPALWSNGSSLITYADITGWSSPTYLASQGANDVVFAYSNWPTPHGGFYTNNRSLGMRPRKVAGAASTDPYTKPVSVVTPGFKLSGTNPVVSWYETGWQALHDPASLVRLVNNDARNVWISRNKVDWTLLTSYAASDIPYSWGYEARSEWRKQEIALYGIPVGGTPLAAGDVVYFNYDLQITVGDNNTHYEYWVIDDFAVEEKIDKPILAASPDPADFGGVQVNATGTKAFTITNIGVSILNITKVELEGAEFALNDTTEYPVEVTDGPETWAYTVGNTGKSVNFSVAFTPTSVGTKTGKITVTYGLNGEFKKEIALTGQGLSCLTATEAVAGETLAPGPNTWYKYTADAFQITTITTCDPRNSATGQPNNYFYDSKVWVYRDCDGTFFSGSAEAIEGVDVNDDMDPGAARNCLTNRASSKVQFLMNEGETVYIFWDGLFANDCATCNIPFWFHINPNYPMAGDVCETAIPLTLPVVNHFGTTVGFADDYNSSPCSPASNYMDGNDKVYKITLPYEGYLSATLIGAYGSVHVLDMCPKVELEKFHCKAFLGGPTGGTFNKKIAAGDYFVIISTWSPPQTVDYLLNMSFQGTGIDQSELSSNLNVYPNPTNGKFTVNISNVEATDMTLELVNISGQVVYRNEVKSATSYNEDIDASTFAKGVYYLKVSDAKGVKIEKVVVQ